jgi:hypothetical protein
LRFFHLILFGWSACVCRSAVKLIWLMENVPAVAAACTAGRCVAELLAETSRSDTASLSGRSALFGTVDSWLIWVSSVFFFVWLQCAALLCSTSHSVTEQLYDESLGHPLAVAVCRI